MRNFIGTYPNNADTGPLAEGQSIEAATAPRGLIGDSPPKVGIGGVGGNVVAETGASVRPWMRTNSPAELPRTGSGAAGLVVAMLTLPEEMRALAWAKAAVPASPGGRQRGIETWRIR